MSIGSSGRIVIEIDADTKRRLYAALISEGRSLKDWFLCEVKKYISDDQPPNRSAEQSRKRRARPD